ncbi:hypothetical protein GGX14DRAFT_453870 [Mycena pura]|uniref:Uncharacterized protein n=1 Tax=Mycena pura TaxID=153505 RepID=A0AAD6VFT9_9AGAR|nr:hypothetical protein GGX14DRAFT_453870 [Mycena pura]
MNCSDNVGDPLRKEFMDASVIFHLDERERAELSAARAGKDLSLVFSRIERTRRLSPHLSTFVDAYSVIIEPFISTSAPIWGPIVFALQLSMDSDWALLASPPPHASLDLDTILEVFDDISDHLTRLVASNQEFFGDEVVKKTLSLIYGDVIKICLQIISTIPRDSQRWSGLGRVGRLFITLSRSTGRIIALRNQIPQNLGFSSGAVVALKVLQTEFHQHAEFIADYAVKTRAASESFNSIQSFLHPPPPSRAEVNISTMPPDIILEIFSIVRVTGRCRWWINCFSFASTSRHIRACCMPALFRRAYLRVSEIPSYDPGEKILRCFRHCSISAPEVPVQPAMMNRLLLWLPRMQSLESITFSYASMVPFSVVEKVLTSLPLLRTLDIMHTPCPLIPPFGGFSGHIRQFSFTPTLKLVSPPEVRQRQVFDPPDDEEVSAVSAALHSALRQLRRTVETLDVPVWCFPLEQLRGTPWTGLRVLSLRGYLPENRRPTPTILGLFPHLESLEIEVVRTDPSLIENPHYLWVDSEDARFPSQLKHLSLIDVGTMDPIFRHLPADLDSLSIIDTRSRKYGINFEVPGYDDDYRTWLTHAEIKSTTAGNPQSFAGLTYLRMSISNGRQSGHWYYTGEGDGRFYYAEIPLDLLHILAASCPLLGRLDLHFQRQRFLLPSPEDFAEALSPIRHTLGTLCIEQPHWDGMPAYPKHLTSHRKASQKQWFDFIHAWLSALNGADMIASPSSIRFTNFARHINELTDYDKHFTEGDEDWYFYSEPVRNPHLLRYSAWRHS